MTYKGNFAALTGTEREALEDVLRAGDRMSNAAFQCMWQKRVGGKKLWI